MSSSNPTPHCLDCGHEPCLGCVSWCDTMIRRLACPKCDATFGNLDEMFIDQVLVCPECAHSFPLSDLAGDDGRVPSEVEPCCDGECRWDRPIEEVAAWCAHPGPPEQPDPGPLVLYSTRMPEHPTVHLRYGQVLAVKYKLNGSGLEAFHVVVEHDRGPAAADVARQQGVEHGRREGLSEGRDQGFLSGFLAAQGIAQGLSEEEAISQALAQVEPSAGLHALAWAKTRHKLLQERVAQLQQPARPTADDDELLTAQAELLQRMINDAEIGDSCKLCGELLDKPDNDHGDGELLGHLSDCPVPDAAQTIEAVLARLSVGPSMPCPDCRHDVCTPVADEPHLWRCGGCGFEIDRSERAQPSPDSWVRQTDKGPVAFGYFSDADVPLEEAYNEARGEVIRLQTLPKGSPQHKNRRDFYRSSGGWGSHFGRASEDLDELDLRIANLSTIEYELRNAMRRTVSCVRTHLCEGYDEIDERMRDLARTAYGHRHRNS